MVVECWETAALIRARHNKFPKIDDLTKKFDPKIARDAEIGMNQQRLFAALMARATPTKTEEG